MDAAFHKLLASKQLEVHTKLDLIGARCHEVRPAESREEVIQRFLVRDIERGKPQRHLRMLSAQQVVSAYAEIEEMTRRDTWRIVVVVRCAICRNTHSQGAAMCVTASRDPLGRRRERVATKETNLRLLIGSEGQGCSKIWDRPRNQTTVISPGER